MDCEISPLQTITRNSEGGSGDVAASNTQGNTVQRPVGEERCGEEEECGEYERGDGDHNSMDNKCGESKMMLTKSGSNDGDENEDSVICEVKRGFCNTHQERARKTKKVWKEWAKNERSGLFGFRQRQSTTWRCVAGLSKPTNTVTQLRGKGAG